MASGVMPTCNVLIATFNIATDYSLSSANSSMTFFSLSMASSTNCVFMGYVFLPHQHSKTE
jgi:hypothetical protein